MRGATIAAAVLLCTAAVLLCTLVSVSVARYSQSLVGKPCNTYTPCGERVELSSDTTKCTKCMGPNVCKTTTTYSRKYYDGVYKKVYNGWWGGWSLKCVTTSSTCTEKNYTVSEYHCCDGFTDGLPLHTRYHKKKYLRRSGCPKVLHETIADCIDELELTQIASVISGTSLEKQLANNDSTALKFTLFAPVDEAIVNSSLSRSQLQSVILSHIAMGEIHSKFFYDDKKIKSLSPGKFIHISQPSDHGPIVYYDYSKWDTNSDEDTYVNGIELQEGDACFASNGIVHLIKGIIDSSDQTIAQVVQSSSELSTIHSLLVAANLLQKLNDTHSFSMTFFAPTNEAFDKAITDIGVDIAKCLLADENKKQLKQFLKYHIVCGTEYSAILSKKSLLSTEACSVSGWLWSYWKCETVGISINDDGGIAIGKTGSVITHLDVPASNGVIHYLSLPLVNPVEFVWWL